MKRLSDNIYFYTFIICACMLFFGWTLSFFEVPLLFIPSAQGKTYKVLEVLSDEFGYMLLPFYYQSDHSSPEPEPEPEVPAQQPQTPAEPEPEGAMPIKTLTVTPASYMQGIDGVYVKNDAKKDYDLKKMIDSPVQLGLNKNSDDPQILIVHTHATETYNNENWDYYLPQKSYRSDDDSLNMVHIGDIIGNLLTQAGYKTIHTNTHHDVDFNRSYSSSYKEISAYLEKYPSIKVVLDVHRDTIITGEGVKYRTVTQIDGKQSSQVMLLMGCGNDTYKHPNWEKNFTLACHIQKTAAELYPNLMRPILLRDARYNEHLSTGSLLVEVGTCGNSPQEARLGAESFARVLINVLNESS